MLPWPIKRFLFVHLCLFVANQVRTEVKRTRARVQNGESWRHVLLHVGIAACALWLFSPAASASCSGCKPKYDSAVAACASSKESCLSKVRKKRKKDLDLWTSQCQRVVRPVIPDPIDVVDCAANT